MFTHVLVWGCTKSESGVPGPENVPRGAKSTTFAHVFFQQFNQSSFSFRAWAMEPHGCLWLHSSRASLSQCMISWWLTKAFVATMLLLIYPYGSTIKCKDNIIIMAIRSKYVVISAPLWPTIKCNKNIMLKQCCSFPPKSVWGHVLG